MPRRLKIALTIGLASLLCSVAFAWTAGPWATGGKNPMKMLKLVKTLKGKDPQKVVADESWAKGQVYEVPQGRVFAVTKVHCASERADKYGKMHRLTSCAACLASANPS